MNNLLYHYNLCSVVAQCLCDNCFLYSIEYEIVLNYFTSVYFLIGCSFKLSLEDLVYFYLALLSSLFCISVGRTSEAGDTQHEGFS